MPDFWADNELTKLRKLWSEGLPTAEIARRIGRTKNSVVGKAHRLNLPRRESPIRPAETPSATTRQHLPRSPIPQQLDRIARNVGPTKLGRDGAAAVQRALMRTQQAGTPSSQGEPNAPGLSKAVRLAGRACRYCLPSGVAWPRWRHCDAPIPDDGRRLPYCDEHYARCIAQPRKQEGP